MVVSCEQVWNEVSNYLDGEADATLRAAIEQHLRGCKHCTAVVDGTRNVVALYGDDRLIELPAGFTQRLHQRLEASMPRKRGTAFGWMVAFSAAALVLIGFEVGSSRALLHPDPRSEQAQPVVGELPADLMVLVSEEGKTFHLPGCRFNHDKGRTRMVKASEAQREGYAPCIRCLRKYLIQTTSLHPLPAPALRHATVAY